MTLIKEKNDSYLLIYEDDVPVGQYNNLDNLIKGMLQLGVESEELEMALLDMVESGTNCAEFGILRKKFIYTRRIEENEF